MNKTLKAGVSRTDISPGHGIELAGYPHYDRANTGIHDPLYASCLYLENGENRIALVSLDLLNLPKPFLREIRNKVESRTQIPKQNIMICCTHTHSGPQTAPRMDMEGIENRIMPDARYMADTIDKIENTVLRAWEDTFDAQIAYGKGICGKEQGIGGNRRDPDGACDPEVWTIGVKDITGAWRACVVKYALHPTVLHGESTLISADYPGYLRSYIEGVKPGVTTLFLQGTSGNQSSRYYRSSQTFEEARRIGEAIGKEADSVLESMKFAKDSDIVCISSQIKVSTRKLPALKEAERNIESAKKHLEDLVSRKAPYVELRTAEVNLLGAENLYGYALALSKGRRLDFLEDEMPVEIQVMGVGELRFVGIQGEIFVEFGNRIKNSAPFEDTFVIELANGRLPGYLCTKEAYEEGGYEAGSSLLVDESGEEIIREALRLLHETK